MKISEIIEQGPLPMSELKEPVKSPFSLRALKVVFEQANVLARLGLLKTIYDQSPWRTAVLKVEIEGLSKLSKLRWMKNQDHKEN